MLVLATGGSAIAQQDVLYSQYLYNGLAINPAYAGSRGSVSGILLYRQQWVGIDGAPTSINGSLHSPLLNDKFAIGINFSNQKVGVLSQTHLNAIGAYRIKIQKGTLSMGLQATYQQATGDFASVNTAQANDPSFSERQTFNYPNFGTGIYYFNKNFFAGFSVPNILNHNLYVAGADSGNKSQLIRHYFATAGGVFRINEDFQFKPSGMVRLAANSPVQADINGTIIYQDFLMGGVSLRNFDALAASVQVFLGKQWWLGYAHDWSTNGFNAYNNGTHEIFIGFDYFFRKPQILTPRYF